MVDKKPVTVRTRKLTSNRLLNRRQFIIDVIHPTRVIASREDITAILAKTYKVQDPKTIFIFGFKTVFGGGKSTGFGLIYDTLRDAKRFEPKYRLIRNQLVVKKPTSRKQRKERKNRQKKVRGHKKVKAAAAKK